MTQLNQILALISRHVRPPFGARGELARAIGKDRSQVTRYNKTGEVPVDHFPALMEWASAHGCGEEMLEIIGLRLDNGVYIRAKGW